MGKEMGIVSQSVSELSLINKVIDVGTRPHFLPSGRDSIHLIAQPMHLTKKKE